MLKVTFERLKRNPYPGRGIVIGESAAGDITQVYWMMGRSTNSRNRVLVQEGDSVRTDLFDKTRAGDTSLIIYNAMRIEDNVHIVSNGDQTDTIAQFLKSDPHEGFEQALLTRSYEPDDPNFTPRISGASFLERTYKLSIIRRGKNDTPLRRVFVFKERLGLGDCIHTYSGDGNPLPSFVGNPYPVPLGETIDRTADMFWGVLNEENKVAIVVKTINARTGEADYRIRNKLSPTPTTS